MAREKDKTARENNENHREIVFYGENTAEQLKTLKLVTIRKPAEKYHGFEVGEEIVGRCGRESVPLVVWGVLEDVPLNEMDPVLLACDGFLNLNQAVQGLGELYEDVKEDTPMTLIATVHKEVFDELGSEQREALLGQKEGALLDEVVRNQLLTTFIVRSVKEWYEERSLMFLYNEGVIG